MALEKIGKIALLVVGAIIFHQVIIFVLAIIAGAWIVARAFEARKKIGKITLWVAGIVVFHPVIVFVLAIIAGVYFVIGIWSLFSKPPEEGFCWDCC